MVAAYAAGGVPRTTFTLAGELAQRGRDVEVISLNRSAASPRIPLDAAVTLRSIRDRYDPSTPDRPGRLPPADRARNKQPSTLLSDGGAHPTFTALTDQGLERLIRGRGRSVFVSTRPEFAVAASRWAAPGSVILHQEHLTFSARPARMRAALKRLAHGDGDGIPLTALLTLTNADRDRWQAYLGAGSCPVGMVANATPFPIGSPAPLTASVVVAVGRLEFQKGFERLVEAWRPIAHSHPQWQLKIFGEGDQQAQLTRQIESAGLVGRVLLAGVTSDIESELRRASVFAMSSRYEGLPMVLLEAMSLGVPPVAFDCPEGPRQLIRDGVNGRLVPDGDVPALTRALTDLMDAPATRRRLGAASQETAREYAPGPITDQWEAWARGA